jgi:hypothetical protein
MDYERLGRELNRLVSLRMFSAVKGIVECAPKHRRAALIRAAGFFKGADLARERGFSRQYAHKMLAGSRAWEFEKAEMDGSVWWTKGQKEIQPQGDKEEI